MKNRIKWLFGGALLALVAGAAYAQIAQTSITGNECWQAGQGPAGPGQYLCINQVRNGQSLTVVPSVSGNPTTQLTQNNSMVYWTGAAPTTWTVNLPSGPFDGEIVEVGTDTTLTSMVTVVAAAGTSLNTTFASQTINAKSSVEFRYSAGTTKWYETR
jgi:hypothetical protein